MAGIFRDGFDLHNGTGASPGMQSKWSTASAVGSLVTGRFTGQAFQNTNSGNGTFTAPFASAQANFTAQFSFNVVTAGTTGVGPSIYFTSAGTVQIGLEFFNGQINVYRLTSTTAGTLLGTSSVGSFIVGNWYTLQAEIEISATVGRVTLYVDGTQVLNLTGQNTKNASAASCDGVGIQSRNGSTLYAKVQLDDLYITDSSTRLGDLMKIETIRPDGDGGTLNLVCSTGTSHFALVNDSTADTATYLQGSAVGDVDELTLGNLSSTPASIAELGLIGYALKTDVSVRSINLGAHSGATTSDGSNLNLSSSVSRFERQLATDPNTSAAWTGTNVNALIIRPKVAV